MLDRLPTPWGLVRLGVAPDHENIKAVSRAFEKTAARPGFRFFGNVEVGRDVTHEELLGLLRRRRLHRRRADRPAAGDPGRGPARLVARHGVRRLVQRPPRLPGSRLRPLARAGRRDRERERRDRLRPHARADRGGARADRHDRRRRSRRSRLAGSREIVMLGRRGPVQAAFTPPELKELGELAGADVIVDPADLELDAGERARARGGPRARPPQRRAAARVRRAAARRQAAPDRAALPRLAGRDPRRRPGRGRRGRAERARRGGRPHRRAPDRRDGGDPGRPRPAQRRLPGRRAAGRAVRRAQRRRSRTTRGRVAGAERTYVAGWIKRGPSGVIGTNKKDATETVELLLDGCARRQAGRAGGGAGDLAALLDERGVDGTSTTPAGRRSTPPSAPPASRSAVRG